ncbi:MAG: hypothetical protein COA58_16570 [Bacteroidetes bacterium]|nr:MAG: hypothetical protein COA58_16570 [Bacteroidota bacterium]
MEVLLILEIISVLFNIIFLVLLTKEIKQCWIYGIVGSLLGSFIVYHQGLFSESILYLFYAFIGVYALIVWHTKSNQIFKIKRLHPFQSIILVASGVLVAVGLGYMMSKTEANKPYLDALSTVFGIIATFLEIYKFYIAWVFWIFINCYSTWLYTISDLYPYALQMFVYTLMSIYGLIQWRKKFILQA